MSSVLIVGGAGYQGRHAAKILASRPGIDHLVLVDREGIAIDDVASELGSDVTTDYVDVRDPSAVAALLRRHQPSVVLNCAGPFRIVGADSAAAAISTGTNYIDILDDAAVVPDYLALDDRARAAGVTVICGAGFTPGLTNIIGRVLAEGLDDVEQMHWSYLVNTTLAVAPHLMTHRVQMYGSDTRVVEDGELVHVPGGSRMVDIEWPGVGTFKAGVCAHPEPLMAQRYFPTLRRASIRGCYTAPAFLELLAFLGNANFGSDTTFTSAGLELRPDVLIGDFLGSDSFKASRIWDQVLTAEQEYGPVDGVRVAVSGRRDGVQVGRVLQYVSRERWLTTHGVAAVAAELVATGAVDAPGVHSAEVLDPHLVLPALRAAGIDLGDFVESDAPEFHEVP